MANYLSKHYGCCHIYVKSDKGRTPATLNSNVIVHAIEVKTSKFKLNLYTILKTVVSLIPIRNIRRYIREQTKKYVKIDTEYILSYAAVMDKYDLYISYSPSITKALYLYKAHKIITMLHSYPYFFFQNYNTANNITLACIDKAGPVQVLMPSFIKKTKNYLPNADIVYIPNIIRHFKISYNPDNHILINIARVYPEKNQLMLVRAFKIFHQYHPDYKLYIYGNLLYQNYVKQVLNEIEHLQLQHAVKLCGITNDIKSVLQQAEIFVFPSVSEGFGLALGEAMAAGIPAIGLKTCAAVNELIVDGVNGMLADNSPEDFAAKLSALADNRDLKLKMSANSKIAMQDFTEEKVSQQWFDLIDKTVQAD